MGGSQLGNTAERNSLLLKSELAQRSAAPDAGTRRLQTPACNEPLRPKFTPTRPSRRAPGSLKFASNFRFSASHSELAGSCVWPACEPKPPSAHVSVSLSPLSETDQVNRASGFPSGPAQVTGLVYLYAHGDARISLTLPPFALRLSRSRRRTTPGSRRRGQTGRSWIHQERARPGGGNGGETHRRVWCTPSVWSASKVGNKLLWRYGSRSQCRRASFYSYTAKQAKWLK